MSVSRDDFSIAFRSALLKRGGAQKFSVLSLIFLALIIFFLDVYGAKFTKPVRGFLNDVVLEINDLQVKKLIEEHLEKNIDHEN